MVSQEIRERETSNKASHKHQDALLLVFIYEFSHGIFLI